ncbi:MAG: class I SAM-dependent methyltransferase [Nevskia sp.]|nr:class I SAM-dependent methyltransferase [Nevskia sp.]
MNLYDRYLLPTLIDLLCGIKPVQRQRAKIVPLARGRVLEIGIGTGRNLPFYDKSRLQQLYGLDPAPQMHHKARQRMQAAGLQVELLDLPAEKIPMPDASFDTVVSTFTLCSIPDVVTALREMRRVLKPGGRLLFCEHGTAPDASVRRWQDRLTPLWKPIAGGCHLNRDIPALLCEAGFHIDAMEQLYLPGPRPLTYNYWGSASAAA